IKAEDFLGRSYRTKVKEWLQLPALAGPGEGERMIDRGRERIRVMRQHDCGPGTHVDDVLVVENDFVCSPGCIFSREIYVRRDCRIGAGSRLQAAAVDGSLT